MGREIAQRVVELKGVKLHQLSVEFPFDVKVGNGEIVVAEVC